jgi:hypothetical protein
VCGHRIRVRYDPRCLATVAVLGSGSAVIFVALLFLVTIRFQTPVCATATKVTLYGHPQQNQTTQTLASHASRSGKLDSLSFSSLGQSWSLWLKLANSLGHEGCAWDMQNYTVVTDVDTSATREIFDLVGRRVHPPFKRGIYFTRTGGKLGRIVVVR